MPEHCHGAKSNARSATVLGTGANPLAPALLKGTSRFPRACLYSASCAPAGHPQVAAPGSTLTPPMAAMRPRRSITICVANWRSSATS
jgi:hypothetical protein